MQTEDPLPVRLGRLRDRADRERAGVRGEDHVGRGLGVERPEDRSLETEVLERGLDDQRRLGREPIEDVRVAKTGHPPIYPVVDGVGIEVEPRRPTRETVADAGIRSFDRLGVHVVEHDLPVVLERDLGDAGAHHAGADDPEGRHTDFIASNGWRQARQ